MEISKQLTLLFSLFTAGQVIFGDDNCRPERKQIMLQAIARHEEYIKTCATNITPHELSFKIEEGDEYQVEFIRHAPCRCDGKCNCPQMRTETITSSALENSSKKESYFFDCYDNTTKVSMRIRKDNDKKYLVININQDHRDSMEKYTLKTCNILRIKYKEQPGVIIACNNDTAFLRVVLRISSSNSNELNGKITATKKVTLPTTVDLN